MEPQTAEQIIKAVLVTAMAHGAIAEREQELVRKLQKELKIDDGRMRELIAELRRGGDLDAWLPADPEERRRILRLMIITAHIDGEISGCDWQVLEKVAERMGLDRAAFERLVQDCVTRLDRRRIEGDAATPTAESPELRHRAEAIVQEIYRRAMDAEALGERIGELVGIGPSAVLPLVRGFESYLRPSPPVTLARVKEAFAAALGRIGDSRAVYYLATFLMLGDQEGDTNDSMLRAAVAEAIGKLAGEPFARSSEGVTAAREWWSRTGSRRYQTLIS